MIDACMILPDVKLSRIVRSSWKNGHLAFEFLLEET